jgi:predicted PurR-regulated permease PerM
MSDRGTRAPGEDGEIPSAPGSASPSRDPFVPWSRAFVRHAALWLMAAIVGGLVLAGIADSLLHRLAGFLQIVMISLFLSFAIEPAVSYLARRGWRRGAATGLVFLAVLVAAAGLVALLVPAVVTGTRQLITVLPDLVHNLARYLKPLGIQVNQADIENQVRTYGNRLLSNAQGPQMRRAVLSRFRPDRQRRILFVWERAIEQTGGYFYSRLLLAVINGALMYAVLRWRGVPFAAPLAVFEGVVSEFIPIVGTYVAGAAPVLVALLYDPVDALIVLIWIVVYQQVENYYLSPRLTAKTMALPAPVAFAAALIGGALGGILFAFLALPTAGVIVAAVRAYGRYYEVVESAKTAVCSPASQEPEPCRTRRRWWQGRWPHGLPDPPDREGPGG